MDWKCASSAGTSSFRKVPLKFSNAVQEKAHCEQEDRVAGGGVGTDIDIDVREIYFLIMHFLSAGPCQRTFRHLLNELLEHQLLPRRYHSWFSRSGAQSGNDHDDGISFPLSYSKLVERYPHVEKDHLVKLLKQLLLSTNSSLRSKVGNTPNAADVPTLLGSGSFSLLDCSRSMEYQRVKPLPGYLRWPHLQADQVRGLSLREIGGGFTKHHRAPSIRSACYAVAKPSTMVQKMQNIKKLRGHRDAVYCAIFDRSGRYVITGSDDRLVKIWSMETAFCLASCRGHEGDITDLAVSSNNALVASASNDFVIRVWRLPDGMPISVLRGHTGVVTAIAFSPRPSSVYQLLSSSDDGTCRIWDARYSQCSPRIYVPSPSDAMAGKSNGPSINGPPASNGPQSHQILCCAYNANGTVFVTGSSDTYARVWSALKSNTNDAEEPIHELDVLRGHENDVNYVQFSGCAVAPRSSTSDALKEDNVPKFKNSWFCHDNIVTCSRDGSAIIWIPRSRRSHGKFGRWTRAYHLKVPPPPLPPQPPRGGPRQRFLPTPRGVNMIVWSLDNRFVLAAIMDCRICVWNAVDGSLVHSLTGHTASSYVLDVHPFNPRIAMSAGYDGKTIIWDIWEGTPIRIYEIGRFKLVDGKFSQDGTSIVLSDEVGQIYLLNTGQGESQKDAKYDQFFLGDYRPLIRDNVGNVLDQETQLVPHRRNLQDPLCDSSMVPYPEPYQTMYQQRRLGALGVEWRPSSIKFAIGPDISLGQDYEMPPLADLERMIEPLPEFIETMYWEPENEVVSDDNDSEYNVTGECSTEGERGSLCSITSSDPECSAEDSEDEHCNRDGLRRSRRRKYISEAELVTSSGRRVKKRNLGEHDGSVSRSNRAKKSKSGQKASKKKSSEAKTLRPQRVAARNARSMLSKITGSSTDGDNDDESEDDSSSSESLLQDSDIQSSESNRNLPNVQQMEKQPLIYESGDMAKPSEVPESQMNIGNRKRLVLKFSLRDSRKLAPTIETGVKDDNQADLILSSSRAPQETFEGNRIFGGSNNLGSTSVDVVDVESENHDRLDYNDRGQAEKAEDHLPESASAKENVARWGEVKIRTTKHARSGDLMQTNEPTGFSAGLHVLEENQIDVNRDKDLLTTATLLDLGSVRNRELVPAEEFGPSPSVEQQPEHGASIGSRNGDLNLQGIDWFPSDNHRNCDSLEVNGSGGTRHSHELKVNTPLKLTKLRIRTKPRDPRSPSKLKFTMVADNMISGRSDVMAGSPSINHDRVTRWQENDEGYGRSSSVQSPDSDSMLKMDSDTHEWDKPYNDRIDSEFNSVIEQNTSNAINSHGSGIDSSEVFTDTIRRKRSMKMKARQLQPEEWASTSRVAVRSRSSRSRRSGYYDNELSFPAGKKSKNAVKKVSWLMLLEHEEGYRYIPQLGDEVVYFRQGHQEFIESRGSAEVGPCRTLNGYLSAVEICKVEKLDYATYPGSGESCCKIILKFVDPSSGVFGQTFKLTLPELVDFPDFIVEKTRYDTAIKRNWTSRDKCLVWWRNENGEGGSWWEGRILHTRAKSNEFPDSPWERCFIQYKGSECHSHSPWELHDPEIPWENSHVDVEIRDKLLSSFAKLEQSASRNQDNYGIQKLNEAAQKLDFCNRFPVALYPELIRLRLENNYYRSLEALKHDIDVMLKNGQSYFARNPQLSSKMRRLSDWYARTFSKL